MPKSRTLVLRFSYIQNMEVLIVIALVLVGLALLLAEFLFIPGTTVAGLLGAGLAILGIFFAYNYFGSLVGTGTLGFALIVGATGGYHGLSSKTWDRFALHDSLPNTKETGAPALPQVGQEGKTLSALRPFGTAQFDNRNYEVRTDGNFMDTGTRVRVARTEGRKIYVEPI